MQTPAPIDEQTFKRVLEECFPPADAEINDDSLALIERMYEDFVLFDLRRAPAVELEELRPFFRDPEATGSLWQKIRSATGPDGKTHVAFARIFSEDTLPVLALLYWTGDRLAIAIPEEGNLINPIRRAAFGQDASDGPALAALTEARGLGSARDLDDYAEAYSRLEAAGRFTGYDLSAVSRWAQARLGIGIAPFQSVLAASPAR